MVGESGLKAAGIVVARCSGTWDCETSRPTVNKQNHPQSLSSGGRSTCWTNLNRLYHAIHFALVNFMSDPLTRTKGPALPAADRYTSACSFRRCQRRCCLYSALRRRQRQCKHTYSACGLHKEGCPWFQPQATRPISTPVANGNSKTRYSGTSPRWIDHGPIGAVSALQSQRHPSPCGH